MGNPFYKIYGMDCAEEVTILKRELGPLVGGEQNLSFDILNAKMGVTSDAVTSDDIIAAVAKTGMRAEPWQDVHPSEGVEKSGFWRDHGRLTLTISSGFALIAGFVSTVILTGSFEAALGSEGAGIAHAVPFASKIVYGLSILAGVWLVLPKAWHALKRIRPDMNLLMIVAVSGAMFIGEWFEAATVSFLFALSLMLESWSIGRARHAVAALLDLTPPAVRILNRDGSEQEVSPNSVQVGTLFIVRPGEKIALDGVVKNGVSDVNQAPITGESASVDKVTGSVVYAGTINGDGLLEVESTKPASDTTLAHIIKMVSEAQSKRAAAEQWVQRFAEIYTPVVIGLALTVFIGPPLLLGQPWDVWLYRALVLLVIGCPCALVISTPVSIVAALTASARNGVLVKGGTYIELPAHIDAIALDKTGTLTEGKPKVVEVFPLNGLSEEEVVRNAAALESNSDHPLARAIVDYAKTKGIAFESAGEFRILKGKGATAVIDGSTVWLGSHRYLEERKQETPDVHEKLESLTRAGRTIVVIGNDSKVFGFIALADSVRTEAKAIVNELHQAGLKSVVMLTGDNKGTAETIARETGIDEVYAELLPQDKVTAIEKLLSKHKVVAMVGDGVNDAPALARASLGIAMGAIGSDAAIETADIALMSDDLSKVPWLITHSRHTLSIIRQNITLSILIKVTFVALTLMGHASLWSAIAADMGASLLVTFNGLRLLRN